MSATAKDLKRIAAFVAALDDLARTYGDGPGLAVQGGMDGVIHIVDARSDTHRWLGEVRFDAEAGGYETAVSH